MTRTRKAQLNISKWWVCVGLLPLLLMTAHSVNAQNPEREQFASAWKAASRGDQKLVRQLSPGLEHYELFPYLTYEKLRHDRASTPPSDINTFLEQHEDWAFTAGLRKTWLRTLGRQGKWADFLRYAGPDLSTELRCYRARAGIATGSLDGVIEEAQVLWTVGESQHKACDPVFSWLSKVGGITPGLARQRVYLAIAQGNARFTLYLARFLTPQDRIWLERWQNINKRGYRRLDLATSWPDEEFSRQITGISLKQFAQSDANNAWRLFSDLDAHFSWDPDTRGGIIREIALQSAVALEPNTLDVMNQLPTAHRDDQVLQWWARAALVAEDWATLENVISQLPPESRSDGRWRYWQAVALEKLARHEEAEKLRSTLSAEATYYGFLAADKLQKPYNICPVTPMVSAQAVDSLRKKAGFSRALELKAAGLHQWALAEWSGAANRLDTEGLRAAAGLAIQEGWHDRAIFALGNSGDRQFYEWRFPVLWQQEVDAEAGHNNIDPAWVHGLMRSESALIENAHSSAGAKGLMQITPATAKRLSRQHGMPYKSSSDLEKASLNIKFGVRFMRDLLEKYNQNPVLVMGAYNAGPNAVDRWLKTRPASDAAAWVETIPYYETRDYIPRVLAFTTIYDWRMAKPVTRVSSRMPDLDSSMINPVETTTVVCEG